MVVEGVVLKGDLEQAAPLGIVARLEVEGDGDEKLDTGDADGLCPERGLGIEFCLSRGGCGVVGGARHDGRGKRRLGKEIKIVV